jgi:hypothetical protein
MSPVTKEQGERIVAKGNCPKRLKRMGTPLRVPNSPKIPTGKNA